MIFVVVVVKEPEKRATVNGTYIKSTNPSLKTNSTLMNYASRGEAGSNRLNSRQQRSSAHLSSTVCGMTSSGGKSLRKSMNGLFMGTGNGRRDEESSKENKLLKLSKPLPASPTKSPAGYAKRLKRLKNTLIKTKNSLFNRKPAADHSMKCKSTSSPALNKLNRTTGGVALKATSRFDMELDTNQSFVNNLRTRFLKRSRSSKINNNANDPLNSTSITTKLSNTVLGPSTGSTETSKRPRFY